MSRSGQLTWSNYDPNNIFEQKSGRVILLTFPRSDEKLGLEPSILTVAPQGDNVEYCYDNRDFDDVSVDQYLCSVYISGMEEFEKWAVKHDRSKIVVGGYHPTTFPDEFKNLAYRVIKGPCDDIYNTLEQEGQVVDGIVSNKHIPRRDLYDINKNQQVIPTKKPEDIVISINTSIGCNMRPPCDFCASAIVCNTILSKPIELVRREVDYLKRYNAKFCFIRDENFTMQKDWKERLKIISELEDCKLYLFASANTLKESSIEFMAQHNVFMICLGLEDPRIKYKKNGNLDRVCELLHENGIYTYLSFIVNPLEMVGADEAGEFYDILRKRIESLKPEMVCGNFLMPFPGTALWDKYYAFVDREDYKHYDSKTPFLIRNKVLRNKMRFFMFWNQWNYYNSDFYKENIRKFDTEDTLHLRFKELYDDFKSLYEGLWNVRP